MNQLIGKPSRHSSKKNPKTALATAMLALGATVYPCSSQSTNQDGFFAYCTSNQDGTGSCINEETQAQLDCTIVPGQIIECKTAKERTIECVWTSGSIAGQAQFWCDQEAEKTFYDDLDTNLL